MVSGAGERSAKAPSPAPGVCVSLAPAVECHCPSRLRVLNIKKAHAAPPLCRRRFTCAISICVDSTARSGSAQECVRSWSKVTKTLSRNIAPPVPVHIGVDAHCG